jgi:hypothetical protein
MAPQRLAAGFDVDPAGTRVGGKPDRPQDAYSLRCAPQVHGAVADQLAHLRGVVQIELNAVTDNPVLLGERVCSAGHFHGMPLALAGSRAAMAALAGISERRLVPARPAAAGLAAASVCCALPRNSGPADVRLHSWHGQALQHRRAGKA